MDANTQNISEATISLIDSLKSTTSHFGLANSGGEYKIITEMFLYKYFNDKFGYEAKRLLRKCFCISISMINSDMKQSGIRYTEKD